MSTAEDGSIQPRALVGEVRPMLQAAFSKLMQSRIRISPVHALRASSIGHGCARFLVYEQTHHEKRQAHGPELQALFDLGNATENYVVRLLEDMGFEVHERNRTFHDRQHQLTGHLDGRLWRRGWAKSLPIEIKGLNPFTADRIETIDDIRNNRAAWIRKYYGQLQAYQFLGDDELGLFVLFNKSSGLPEFIESPMDREYAKGLLEKARLVRESVLANTLPERHRTADCIRCPFVHVCLPDISHGPGMKILDDVELQEAIRVREANRPAKEAFAAADRTIKAMLPDEEGEVLSGPYLMVGNRIERKAYAVEAGSYVKWDLTKVGAEQPAPPLLNPFTGPTYAENLATPTLTLVPPVQGPPRGRRSS